jgi:hypothetical protein
VNFREDEYTGKIMPGKVASLMVPLDDFPTGGGIYVEFSFSWEPGPGDNNGDETVHRAYFRSRRLPSAKLK